MTNLSLLVPSTCPIRSARVSQRVGLRRTIRPRELPSASADSGQWRPTVIKALAFDHLHLIRRQRKLNCDVVARLQYWCAPVLTFDKLPKDFLSYVQGWVILCFHKLSF